MRHKKRWSLFSFSVGLIISAQCSILFLDQVVYEAICILGKFCDMTEIQMARGDLCHDLMYFTWEVSDKLGISQEVVQSKKDIGLFSYLVGE